MSVHRMRVAATVLVAAFFGLPSFGADAKSSGECTQVRSQPATGPVAASPAAQIIGARCGKVPCKLDDDLTITLAPPVGAAADAKFEDPRVRIALGAQINSGRVWDAKCEVELLPVDLRKIPNGPANERVIPARAFAADDPDSQLLKTLQETDTSEIAVTVASLGPGGAVDSSRVVFKLDTSPLFEANRVSLRVEDPNCHGWVSNQCQFSRTLTLSVPHLYDWLPAQ